MSASAPPTPRVALLTGTLCADAQAVARALAQRGWDVALAVGPHEQAAAVALARAIEATGRRSAVLVADLTVEADAERLVPACADLLGRPSCVVHRCAPGRAEVAAAPGVDRPEAGVSAGAAAGVPAADFAGGMPAMPGYAALADAYLRDVAAPLALARALYAATPAQAYRDESLRAAVLYCFDACDPRAESTASRLPESLSAAALDRAAVFEASACAPRLRVTRLVRGAEAHAEDVARAACYLIEARGATGSVLTVDNLARPMRGAAGSDARAASHATAHEQP